MQYPGVLGFPHCLVCFEVAGPGGSRGYTYVPAPDTETAYRRVAARFPGCQLRPVPVEAAWGEGGVRDG